jgi:hypothetical protein
MLGELNAFLAALVVVLGVGYGFTSGALAQSIFGSVFLAVVIFGFVAIAVDTRESIRGILEIQQQAAAHNKATEELLRKLISAVETNGLLAQKAANAVSSEARDAASKGADPTSVTDDVGVGDVVTHRTLGRGIVMSINAADRTAMVRFDSKGDVLRDINSLSKVS